MSPVSFRSVGRVVETVVSPEVLEASRKGCPFCPGQVDSMTPKFIPEIAPEGRIRKGRAVSFPNSFPYAQYNWVVVLSDEHFYHLDQFSTEILKDGFTVAQEGIRRVVRREPEFTYSSINWNYLPQSGGGLYHPHLQVVVDQNSDSLAGRSAGRIKELSTEEEFLLLGRSPFRRDEERSAVSRTAGGRPFSQWPSLLGASWGKSTYSLPIDPYLTISRKRTGPIFLWD